ncbi:MAG: hypothetical protein WDW38_008111 [Sanguina aurantia]
MTLFLSLLFASRGAAATCPRAASLLLHGRLFQSLDAAIHFMLRCTRERHALPAQPSPTPSAQPALRKRQQDCTIAIIMASCRLLWAIGCLPGEHQASIINGMPARFVDSLCCLAVEVVAHITPFVGQSHQALFAIAALPQNSEDVQCTSLHLLHQHAQEHPADFPARKAVTTLTRALSSPHMLCVICSAFAILTPSIQINPTSDGHPQPPAPRSSRGGHAMYVTGKPQRFGAAAQLVDILHDMCVSPTSVPVMSARQAPGPLLASPTGLHLPYGNNTGGNNNSQSVQTDADGVWVLPMTEVGLITTLLEAVCGHASRVVLREAELPGQIHTLGPCLDVLLHLMSLDTPPAH